LTELHLRDLGGLRERVRCELRLRARIRPLLQQLHDLAERGLVLLRAQNAALCSQQSADALQSGLVEWSVLQAPKERVRQ
jgi:hypothetical protein